MQENNNSVQEGAYVWFIFNGIEQIYDVRVQDRQYIKDVDSQLLDFDCDFIVGIPVSSKREAKRISEVIGQANHWIKYCDSIREATRGATRAETTKP